MSELIQKEKARQDIMLGLAEIAVDSIMVVINKEKIMTHNQSLVNLREFVQDELELWELMNKGYKPMGNSNIELLKENIKALDEMIERYKNV